MTLGISNNSHGIILDDLKLFVVPLKFVFRVGKYTHTSSVLVVTDDFHSYHEVALCQIHPPIVRKWTWLSFVLFHRGITKMSGQSE